LSSWPLGEHVEKAGDEEERQVLQAIQVNSPDSIDALVGLKLLGIRLWILRRFPEVFRRAEAAVFLHHSNDGQPGHAHRLENRR